MMLRIAAIMDEFSRMAFEPEIDYVEISPDDWRAVLEPAPPDLLLVESAWQCNGGRWRHRISRSSGVHPDLEALTSWCRAHDVPTVFWNKEDPVNFERFHASAVLFDHIFTTDADCIPRYRKLAGHDRVGVLPFAAQPLIHNPVAAPEGRNRGVAFAGTYYAEKHPQRRVQMETILDPARDFDMEIFTRVTGDARYAFPEKYAGHISGSLPYAELLHAHKRFKVFLNVNSVVGSRSMCARRIFEVLACGAAIVSGRSPAIVSMLGPGLVAESASPEETRGHLAAILGDDEGRERAAVKAVRKVLDEHTYGDRVHAIAGALGLDSGRRPPTLAVAALGDRAEQALEVVAHQRRQPDAPATAAATLGEALDGTRTDVVAVLEPDGSYGANFLGDGLLAFSYAAADVVGSPRSAGDGYRYGVHLHPGTLFVRREALTERELSASSAAELHDQLARRSLRMFATDPFGYEPTR
jgi:hypothetical protein